MSISTKFNRFSQKALLEEYLELNHLQWAENTENTVQNWHRSILYSHKIYLGS